MVPQRQPASWCRAPLSLGLVWLAACAPTEELELGMVGMEWTLTSMVAADSTIDPSALPDPPTALFTPDANDGSGGTVSGHGGCNLYTARYRALENHGLAVDSLATTTKYCPGLPLEIEIAFYETLQHAATYELGAAELLLRTSQGEVLRFRRS